MVVVKRSGDRAEFGTVVCFLQPDSTYFHRQLIYTPLDLYASASDAQQATEEKKLPLIPALIECLLLSQQVRALQWQ